MACRTGIRRAKGFVYERFSSGAPACQTGCETALQSVETGVFSWREALPIPAATKILFQGVVVFALACAPCLAQAEGWKLGGKELHPGIIIKGPGILIRVEGSGIERKGSEERTVLGAGYGRPRLRGHRDRCRGTSTRRRQHRPDPMTAPITISCLRSISQTSRFGACVRDVGNRRKQSSSLAAQTPKCNSFFYKNWPRRLRTNSAPKWELPADQGLFNGVLLFRPALVWGRILRPPSPVPGCAAAPRATKECLGHPV